MIRRKKNQPTNRPTRGEMEILAALWDRGPSTVRDISELLNKKKATQYTTVLKLLQIMHQKGLVTRDEQSKAHIYAAAEPMEQTQKFAVTEMLEKMFSGSASRLIQQVLETKAASREELAEIRQMISEAESARGKK
jgi:predicted transcriptional regulator